MPVTVDFIFDFASPNAYLTHRVIPEIGSLRAPALARTIAALPEGHPPDRCFLFSPSSG